MRRISESCRVGKSVLGQVTGTKGPRAFLGRGKSCSRNGLGGKLRGSLGHHPCHKGAWAVPLMAFVIPEGRWEECRSNAKPQHVPSGQSPVPGWLAVSTATRPSARCCEPAGCCCLRTRLLCACAACTCPCVRRQERLSRSPGKGLRVLWGGMLSGAGGPGGGG